MKLDLYANEPIPEVLQAAIDQAREKFYARIFVTLADGSVDTGFWLEIDLVGAQFKPRLKILDRSRRVTSIKRAARTINRAEPGKYFNPV